MDYSISKNIINKGSFLSKEDTNYISNNVAELQKNWDKKQSWRTETEMRVSVLQDLKHPTIASKYWQCIREQSTFYESLVHLSFKYRRALVDKEEILNKIEEIEQKQIKKISKKRSFKLSRLYIGLEEVEFSLVHDIKDARERMRELRLWDKIMKELVEADPTFDTLDVNTHQLISYAKEFELSLSYKGAKASPGELVNLVGKAQTADRVLRETLAQKRDSYGAR